MNNPYDTPQAKLLTSFWKEPDHYEDLINGFKVIARRNSFKTWCGYVGVEASHPLFRKDYSERIAVADRGAISTAKASPIAAVLEALHEDDGRISLAVLADVHGGLTYAGDKWPADDGLWYFGFDCNHSGDLSPRDVFNSFAGGIWTLNSGATYRTLDYVKSEIKTLATVLEFFA